MLFIDKRREVHNNKQVLFLFSAMAHKYQHVLIRRNIIDPLKSSRIKVLLKQRRLLFIKFHERLHIRLHLMMLVILEQIPLNLALLIPLVKLRNVLAHKQKLLARVHHHIAVCRTQVCKLRTLLSRHLSDHRAFSMYYLIVRKSQHKILAVRVDHAERKLAVVVRAEERIKLHIAEKIIHPAHIPLIIKSKTVLFYRRCDLWPCRGFFRDQNRAISILLKDRVEMLKEFHCFQILMTAVHICHPFAVILAVIQIQHRSDCVHTDTVCMIDIFPEERICDQEI